MTDHFDNPTIFGKILRGEEPAERVYEDEHCVVFPSKYPKADVHMLIVPRKYITGLQDMTEEDAPLLGHLQWVANRMARKLGLTEKGYRVFINAGAGGGQTVFHLHYHLVSGEFDPLSY